MDLYAADYPGYVVGVDGSEASLVAVDWAAAEAASRSLPLTVCHIVDDHVQVDAPAGPAMVDRLRWQGCKIVDHAVDRVRARVEVSELTGCVPTGRVGETLLDVAGGTQELVVGNHGAGGMAGLLLGSVAARVAAGADGPAVVVRRAARPDGPVLAGVDESEVTGAVLEYAFDHCARRDLPLCVRRAVTDVDDAARQRLDQTLELWQAKFPSVDVEPALFAGHPAAYLAEASVHASLLVVGRHGRGRLAPAVLGSVSRTVLRHAGCPVAVLHE